MAGIDDLRYAHERGAPSRSELARIFGVEAHVVGSWLTSGRLPGWANETARELAEVVRLRRTIDVRSFGKEVRR